MAKFIVADDKIFKSGLSNFLKKQRPGSYYVFDLDDKEGLLTKAAMSLVKSGKRIIINTSDSLLLLKVKEIVRLESNRNYTFIYTHGGNKLLVTRTLKDMEQELGLSRFFRVHKSHLVNGDYVEKYVKSDGGYLVLSDGTRLPVSTRRKEELIRMLEKL